MDFGRAFAFIFEDSDWPRKVGIASLVFLIPLIGQLVVLGWSLRITRRVINGEMNVLPDVDFGQDIILGLQAAVVAFVYSLPIVILTIPSAVAGEVLYARGAEELTAGLAVALTLCLGLFSVLYGIFAAFVIPAAYANVVAHDNLGVAFRFGEVFSLVKRNPGAYLVVLGGIIVTGFIAPLGLIACLVGAAITAAYSQAVNGHLYGQAYRVARDSELAAGPPVR